MGWTTTDKITHRRHTGWTEGGRGDQIKTYAPPATITDGVWAPGSTSKDLAEGHRIDSAGTLYFQRAVTYTPHDEFTVNGITYSVVGHASTVRRNPFTGTVMGTDIALRVVT